MSQKPKVYVCGVAVEVDHTEPIDIDPSILMTNAQRQAMCPHWNVESICIDATDTEPERMWWRCDQCVIEFAPRLR